MSKHVSFELAKQLRDAGLEWEPKDGDWFLFAHIDGDYFTKPKLCGKSSMRIAKTKGNLWLPTLPDLLERLEKEFNLELTNLKHQGSLETFEWNLGLYKEYGRPDLNNALEFIKEFDATTPEDAAAEAVLWVLEQEKEEDVIG